MKEKLNVGVLVTARNEYMDHLKKKLSPLILEGIISIYKDAIETQNNLGSYKYNKQFQIYLNQIPDWNQTILVNETKRIVDKIDYLQKLVTAIFISDIKIKTSIKLGGDSSVFQIKIPKSDLLIHKIYAYVAKTIYSSVDLLDKFQSIEKQKENYNKIKTIIEETIEETILQELIPTKDILEEYLADAMLDDISREPHEDDDDDENIKEKLETSLNKLFEEEGPEEKLTNNFGSSSFEPVDEPVIEPIVEPVIDASLGDFSDPDSISDPNQKETMIIPLGPEKEKTTGGLFDFFSSGSGSGSGSEPEPLSEPEPITEFNEPIVIEEPVGEQSTTSFEDNKEYQIPDIDTTTEKSFF
jgi:hypothetical protein